MEWQGIMYSHSFPFSFRMNEYCTERERYTAAAVAGHNQELHFGKYPSYSIKNESAPRLIILCINIIETAQLVAMPFSPAKFCVVRSVAVG